MEEIWKDVVGYEGLYQVSNMGEVKSLERTIIKSNGREQYIPERILIPGLSIWGYLSVSLYKKESKKTTKIHRLVAAAFLMVSVSRLHVNHIDGNKLNNKVDNLEWCTPKENTAHAFKHKLRKAPRGEINGKLTEKEVIEIRALCSLDTLTHKEIASIYGIHKSYVSKLKLRNSWNHL